MTHTTPLGKNNRPSGMATLAVLREVQNPNCPRWVTVEEDQIPHYKAKGDRIEEVVAKTEALSSLSAAEGKMKACKEREVALINSMAAAKKALAKAVAMRDHGAEWISLTESEKQGMMEAAQDEIDTCISQSEMIDP